MNDEEHPAVSIRDCRLSLGRSGEQRVVFELPELTIPSGEQAALTGPSGCGKSTLLNLVSGLLLPETGAIAINGVNPSALRPAGRDSFRGKHIGFIYQRFNLLDAFSATENVAIGMRFGRSIPHGERRTRARELLQRVGLGHRLHAHISTLSVGEQQRVAIARAIANRPSILLADEPTGALDPATAGDVLELLIEVCTEEKNTLLLVTHDLDLAAKLPRQINCRDLIQHEETSA